MQTTRTPTQCAHKQSLYYKEPELCPNLEGKTTVSDILHQPAWHDQGTLSFKNRQTERRAHDTSCCSLGCSFVTGDKDIRYISDKAMMQCYNWWGRAQCFSPHDQIVIHVCLWDPCRLPSLKLCLHRVPWVFNGNSSQMLPHFTEGASCPSRSVLAACIGGPRHHCR